MMNDSVGYEVERARAWTGWAWKKPLFLISLLLGGGLWLVGRSRSQLSGHYRGSLVGPTSEDLDMELQLEHVGQELSATLVLKGYRNRREPQRGRLNGHLTWQGVSLRGQLDSGELVVLNANVSDDFRWEGKAQLPRYRWARPFSLRKRPKVTLKSEV